MSSTYIGVVAWTIVGLGGWLALKPDPYSYRGSIEVPLGVQVVAKAPDGEGIPVLRDGRVKPQSRKPASAH